MELFTPGFGLVFWMFLSFAVLFFILWKYAWPAIMNIVDERADLIDKGVEYAQNAKEQLDKAQVSAEQILSDARRKEADILREAEAMKSQIIEQARGEAKEQAKKEADAARLAIEQARKEAELSIRDEVGAIALSIAEKVVRNKMKDDKEQAKLVSTLISEIENQN